MFFVPSDRWACCAFLGYAGPCSDSPLGLSMHPDGSFSGVWMRMPLGRYDFPDLMEVICLNPAW
jgi:hypothetical protein